jgi:hypothetical protein
MDVVAVEKGLWDPSLLVEAATVGPKIVVGIGANGENVSIDIETVPRCCGTGISGSVGGGGVNRKFTPYNSRCAPSTAESKGMDLFWKTIWLDFHLLYDAATRNKVYKEKKNT